MISLKERLHKIEKFMMRSDDLMIDYLCIPRGTIVPSWKVLSTFLGLKVLWRLNILCSLFWLPFFRLVAGVELTTRWVES